jgi:predicted ATPase/class 3 adenylate cyclase
MSALPTGTVTYLFTDIEGSTQRWEHQHDKMEYAFTRHEEIMRATLAEYGGHIYKMIGDAFQVAFSTAPEALTAAYAAQRALNNEPWGDVQPVKVRMALHTGETEERIDDYVGPLLNRVARLMSVAYGGQVLMTHVTYELVRDHLPEGARLRDLGEHRLKDIDRPERIYQLVAEGLPQEFPALKTLDAHPNNLPTKLTSFVGRDEELREVKDLLSSTRLLTLTGQGGVGKTRLAVQAARQCIDEFDDGAYFVPLAPVSSPEYIVPSIADALQFNFDTHAGTTDTMTQLLEYLRGRSMLMVMDNFEHLVEGGSLVTYLLEGAPKLNLILTSRERLNLQGEWTYIVEGMDFPENGGSNGREEYSAVELFLDRTRQVDPHFTITEENRPYVHHVCRLVEGIPLAIELDAGWVSVLSPQEIIEEIDQNIDFLVSSQRDLPEKHRSIRAVFNHSWELLAKDQRAVLRKLSVFRGGFDRDAAMKVTNADLNLLSEFVNKSLLRTITDGRYEVHELLRQYAEEKLLALPEEEVLVRARHSRYFVEYLSQRQDDLFGEKLVDIREEIRTERDNIREAVYWAVVHWDADEAIDALDKYNAFYLVQGWVEGKEDFNRISKFVKENRSDDVMTSIPHDRVYQFTQLLIAAFHSSLGQHQESDDFCHEYLPTIREHNLVFELTMCLQALGINAFHRGEYDLSKEYLVESITRSKEIEKHFLTGLSLMWLGYLYCTIGDNNEADALYQESLSFFEREGNLWGKTFTISKMGSVADSLKDFKLAKRLHEESRELFVKFGDLAGEAYTNSRLSIVAYHEGDYAEAVRYGRVGLDKFDKLGQSWGVPISLCRIGFPTLAMGEVDKAEDCFFQAMELALKTDYVHMVLYALSGIASVMVEEREYEKAAEIFGLFLHHPQTPAMYKEFTQRWHDELTMKLPTDVYEAAYERGKASELDQIVESLQRERTTNSIELSK